MTAGTSTTPAQARPGRQLPFAAVLLGAVVLALSAALSIATLRGAVDATRRAVANLANLEATVHEQTVFELRAIATGSLEPADAALMAAGRERAARLLQALTLDERASFGLGALRAAIEMYRAALAEQLEALADGNATLAQTLERTSVTPARESLQRVKAATEARLEASAVDSAMAADVGTLSALLSAAILLSLLFRRWERARRRGAFLVGERQGLAESERRFRSLVQHSSDLITVLGRDGRLGYVSPSAARLLGVQPETLIGAAITSLVHPDDRERLDELVVVPSDHLGGRVVEWRLRMGYDDRSRHRWRSFESTVSAADPDDPGSPIVLNSRDVTERRSLEATLRHQAGHDPLTDLLNRAVFIESMTRALARVRRAGGRIALLFIDLDDFKSVNDTSGHLAGDRVLVEIARRIRHVTRTDSAVARLGGDEFAVLLESVDEPRQAFAVAERITEAIHRPLSVAADERRLAASVGIALSDDELMEAEDLLQAADRAMYAAKRAGGGRHLLFQDLALPRKGSREQVA